MSTVVMAIDGNAGSLPVLTIYRTMAREPDRVILVHVSSPLPDAQRNSMLHETFAERSGHTLRTIKQALENFGPVDVSLLIRKGAVADVVLKVAEEERADLIIVAFGRTTGLRRLWTGCDVAEVERRSLVPVIVAPPNKHIQSAAKNLNGRESYAA